MTAFFVLGCPRSGTSLVSGILHHSGVNMGDQFNLDVVHSNPKGFYEDMIFAERNDRLLSNAGGDDLHPPSEEELYQAAARNGFHHQLVNCINEKMLNQEHWGVKDPRIILLWRHYFPCLCDPMNLRFIFTHRDPINVARSWIQWGRCKSEAEGLRIVAEYERRIADIAEQVRWPVLHLGFEDWWHRPDINKALLTRFVGWELDYSHFDDRLWRS